MKKSLGAAAFILLAFANSFIAQSPDTGVKTFDGGGLKFSYPADWILTDRSTEGVQDLRISRPDTQVMISMVSPRAVIQNYDQFREMQGEINNRFIISIKQSLNTEERTTTEESACLDFNGRNVTGMRYGGIYKEQPSTGDVFPFVLGDRFINLVYMRSDRDAVIGDAVWKDVLGSLYLQNSHRDAAYFDFATNYMAAGDLRGRALYIGRPNLPYNIGRREGLVAVIQVEIDEKGKVTSARSDTPNGPIRMELINAAKQSKFEPTVICGRPVKIRGIIVYKFLPSPDLRMS